MRVAIVHDWLYVVGGAEQVLKALLKIYPQADVFTLFDFLSAKDRAKIGLKETRTSFLQKLPLMREHHRLYLPLMPIAIEQFDLSAYDLIVSSSYAVAKGVLTGPDQLHVAYVHSPMRYAWDLQHEYLKQSNLVHGLKSAAARLILHGMRMWDHRTANGPDALVANSSFVARRIRKVYGRQAEVIHPPVAMPAKLDDQPKGGHFLVASRLVPYKNVDAIVGAFAQLPELTLIVAGSGPEEERLRRSASSNVTFAGFVSDAELRRLMATARAFVFAAEEDFGIIVVEALSEGTPVLALEKGGARETVAAFGPNRSGMFFPEAHPDPIAACIRAFIAEEASFSPEACRRQAEQFSAERFQSRFPRFVDGLMTQHRAVTKPRLVRLEAVS